LNEAGVTRRAVLWNGNLKRLYVQKHKAKEHCMNLLQEAFEQANEFSSLAADELFFVNGGYSGGGGGYDPSKDTSNTCGSGCNCGGGGGGSGGGK
jgi:hypothetical protein